MRPVTIAAIQYACGAPGSLDTAERLLREAAGAGAEVLLLPELFETPYFCKTRETKLLGLARPLRGHGTVERMADLARELGAVIPVTLYEAAGPVSFCTLALIDADGAVLGQARKAHLPQGPGTEESFYFAPGDTGFPVLETAFGAFGFAMGHDALYPEAARAMALEGAEALLCPLAMGAAAMPRCRAALHGHAAANALPVAAANRIGAEAQRDVETAFPGGSLILGGAAEPLAEAGAGEGIALATLDLDAAAEARRAAGLFHARRPDLYGRLTRL